MANLSDFIEEYLKELLNASREGAVEIQRNELAERFRCVPSQINYVLSTRFNWDRGYLVKSRRGGGGYVRIFRVVVTGGDQHHWFEVIRDIIGEAITQREAMGLVSRLGDEGLITIRERRMLEAIIDRNVLKKESPNGDILRARLLKAAILSMLRGE